MEDSERVEVEVQATLSEIEMHGMETDVGKFGVVIIAGDDNEVQNRVGEAEVHRVETDVSKSGVESSTGA